MKYDHILLRDEDGKIRFPDTIKLDEHQAEKLADSIFMMTSAIVGVKQLDKTFAEYDKSRGLKGQRGAGRKWSDEEKKYVLLHHEDGDESVADELGRTSMSIFMRKSELLSAFDSWKNDNADRIAGRTREEIVDIYFGDKEWQ